MAWGGGIFGAAIPIGRTLYDELPDYYLRGNAEAIPEAYGNLAGPLLVPAFNLFFNLHTSEDRLAESIRSLLCKKQSK